MGSGSYLGPFEVKSSRRGQRGENEVADLGGPVDFRVISVVVSWMTQEVSVLPVITGKPSRLTGFYRLVSSAQPVSTGYTARHNRFLPVITGYVYFYTGSFEAENAL